MFSPAQRFYRLCRAGFCSLVFLPLTLIAAVPGSVDPTFNPGRGPNFVNSAVGQGGLLQLDGKFIVGGRFQAVNLTKVAPLVRFHANGSLDTTFNASSILPPDIGDNDAYILPLALLSNGKILVGGKFDTIDGVSHPLLRLNANGSVDTAFNPQIVTSTPDSRPSVFQAIVQPDGKILIRGSFSRVNNVPRRSLARLNSNGSLDNGFNPNLSGAGRIALRPDGKILVVTGGSIVRLNSNGTLDPAFHAGSITAAGIGSMLVQSDGKIVVSGPAGGFFETFSMSRLNEDGSTDGRFPTSGSLGIALQTDDKILSFADGYQFQRLNADGSLDSSFHPTVSVYFPEAIAEYPDGRLLFVGQSDAATPYGIDRILPNGSHDPSFAAGMGLTNIRGATIQDSQLLPSGKIVVTGEFNHFDLLPRKKIAVLNSNGSPDPNFDAGNITVTTEGVENSMNAIAVESDGKILVAIAGDLFRLNADGRVDSTFRPPDTPAVLIAPQRDGKILIGTGRGPIRLQPNGSIDSSFNASQAGLAEVQMVIQPDGKILLNDNRGLVRLNQNGSLDSSFRRLGGSLTLFGRIAVQPNGKIFVTYTIDGIGDALFLRLNSDGTNDSSFPIFQSSLFSPNFGSFALDQTGIFVRKDNTLRRLSLDGTLDPIFRAEFSPSLEIKGLVQANGQLIVAGSFDKVNNTARPSIARINGSAPEKAANISTRARVGNGEAVEIGGFVIQGTARKNVLIRAIGPSIQNGGTPLPGTLVDPVLELHDANGPVFAFNDDWRSFLPGAILNTGLAPTNERESAINRALLPGAYTAVLRGKNGGTGIALLEVYDLDPSANSRLGNISTRGSVGVGDNVLIGGFIFRGSQPKKILVRAIGPSLRSAGIVNPLNDPVLELHNQSGELVTTNDNWRQSQQSEILATGLAPTNDRESAILTTLPTGVYTAIVRGSNGATGIALVEVYHLN